MGLRFGKTEKGHAQELRIGTDSFIGRYHAKMFRVANINVSHKGDPSRQIAKYGFLSSTILQHKIFL